MERMERAQAEAALEAAQAVKALEEERSKAEKPTPVFPEHLLFELIAKLERSTGYVVFAVQINNTHCATKLYDCARRNRLPAAPDLLPDQSKPLTGADGSLCGYPTKAFQAAAGEGVVAVLMTEEGARAEAKGGTAASKMPTTMAGAHANTSRWFFTLLVVVQHLPDAASFKIGPQATLAYINMLWQVSMYRGMTLDRYMTYRNESLREITTLKFLVIPVGADKAAGEASAASASTDVECWKCDKLKRELENVKGECVNKGQRIATFDAEIGRLKGGGLVRRERGGYERAEVFHRDERDRDRDRGARARPAGRCRRRSGARARPARRAATVARRRACEQCRAGRGLQHSSGATAHCQPRSPADCACQSFEHTRR